MEKFIFLEHPADIKFKAYGKTINELFENVVLAVSSYLSQDKKVIPKKGKVITVNGEDNQSLLYNFVDEMIYLLDAEKFIPQKASVEVRGFNLRAEIYGDDSDKYEIKQIKAATYAEMEIKKVKSKDNKEHWECQMVLDV